MGASMVDAMGAPSNREDNCMAFVRLVWPNGRWSRVPSEDAENQRQRIAQSNKVTVRIMTEEEYAAEAANPPVPASPVSAPTPPPQAPSDDWAGRVAKARELRQEADRLAAEAKKLREEANAKPNPHANTIAKRAEEAAFKAEEAADDAAKALVG